jgi:hypothetical protein
MELGDGGIAAADPVIHQKYVAQDLDVSDVDRFAKTSARIVMN